LKRILVCTDAVGGIWTYAIELAQALRGDFAIEFAILGPPPAPVQMQAAASAGAVVHATSLPLDWTAASANALAQTSEALAGLARRRGVDLVQLHTPALVGGVAWPAPVLAVVHSCVGTWWQAMRGDAQPPADFAWRMAAVESGLGRADAVIVPTRTMRDALRRCYHVRRAIEVVHNTRGFALTMPDAERFGILAAGRLWDEAKNIALLDAAAELMDGIPVHAAGATSGPNGAGIALRSIRGLGAQSPDALRAEMGNARIFASPALYEPFGLAVLEAAQAGLPLVLADIPTFRELWADAAVFLTPRDPRVWANVLSTLHADVAQCSVMGEQARAHATRYDAGIFAGAMRGVYSGLIDKQGRKENFVNLALGCATAQGQINKSVFGSFSSEKELLAYPYLTALPNR
jgi:glycosyltransferase involved in cell wall biosynthesis